MKKIIIMLLILTLLSFGGCDRKPEIGELLDFTAEEVTSVTIRVLTIEEDEILDEGSEEGIKEFIALLHGIQIIDQLDFKPEDATYYYSYSFNLADGDKIQFLDYQTKLKVIDEDGEESWYEIISDTWGGLTELWVKYYVPPIDADFNFGIGRRIEMIQPTVSPDQDWSDLLVDKPIIYLYPEEPTEVSVKLDINGRFTYTYPEYNNGWNVLAEPDGTLHNLTDDKLYSYLFWEAMMDIDCNMNEGFVVKGSDTTKFLEEKLAYLGLTSKEYNDFIVYWAPKMSENPYNLITFQQTDYTDAAELSVSPKPDSMLRVFMAYQPLEEYIEIPEQKLEPWSREGFAVVEWGGTIIE